MSLNAHSLRALNASHASGDMATSESDDFQGESHLSGYLYKQSDHLKQWNLRFFVVGNSDHIKYYKKETDSSPKGFFSVAGCTFTRATKPTVVKGKMLHVFEVSHPLSKNVLRLGSNAEAMTLLWIKTLKQVASGEVQDGTEQQETAQRLARAMGSIGTYAESDSALDDEDGSGNLLADDFISEEVVRERDGENGGEGEDGVEGGDRGTTEGRDSGTTEGNESSATKMEADVIGASVSVADGRSNATRAENDVGVAAGGGGTASRMTKRSNTAIPPSSKKKRASTTKEPTTPKLVNKRRQSALLLPKQNPLASAGLSTKLAITIVLVPLISQFLGRSVMPWYVGNEDNALERMIDVLGNVCFLLGVAVSIIIVLLNRKN